jgi:hypothetical protein
MDGRLAEPSLTISILGYSPTAPSIVCWASTFCTKHLRWWNAKVFLRWSLFIGALTKQPCCHPTSVSGSGAGVVSSSCWGGSWRVGLMIPSATIGPSLTCTCSSLLPGKTAHESRRAIRRSWLHICAFVCVSVWGSMLVIQPVHHRV